MNPSAFDDVAGGAAKTKFIHTTAGDGGMGMSAGGRKHPFFKARDNGAEIAVRFNGTALFAARCRQSKIDTKVTAVNIEPEISFHKMEGSDALKGEIRDHIDRLEKYFGRMTTCRVRVDQRQQNVAGTIPPVVSIEISIPGRKDVVVSHEPGHLQRKFQAPDVNNAVNEAFRIAQQRLAQMKDKMSDHRQAVAHEAAHELKGQVAEMHADQDFGYVMTAEGGLLYFHRNSVLTGDFDALRRGASVSYVEGSGDTGPTASKVRVV